MYVEDCEGKSVDDYKNCILRINNTCRKCGTCPTRMNNNKNN